MITKTARALLSAFLLVVTSFALATDAVGATHTVYLYDFYYSPQHITIDQDDTVSFVWVDDFHDVRSGLPPGQASTTYDNAFNSTVENANYIFQVNFTRALLNENPAPSNVYQYYCSPHYLDNMLGSITVTRHATPLVANGNGAQAVPQNSSSATLDCTGELNAAEDALTLTCNHDVVDATGATLQKGVVGTAGDTVCTLATASPIAVNCPMTDELADSAYNGELFISIASTSYPNGEVRGQIVRQASGLSVSGKVALEDGSGVSNVEITDGTHTTTTNTNGTYTLTGLDSGVYFLSGSKDGYTVQPNEGLNPLLLNAQNRTNQNFIAALGDVCIPDSDDDGICDSVEADDGTSEEDPGSYREHFSSPLYTLWNGFLGMSNILEVINKGGATQSITVSMYDSSGSKASQTIVDVPAKGQRDIILNSLTGFAPDAYGLVTLEFDNSFGSAIDGRVSYYRFESDNSHMQFAFAVPFTSPLKNISGVTFNTFQPSVNPLESQDTVAQWLAIVNLSNETKSFTISLYDQLGNPISTQRAAVNPLSRVDLEAGHNNPGPSHVGLHLITPDDESAPYLAQLFRYGLTADPAVYRFAFPLLARAGNGETQSVSISRGADAENWLELANTLPASVGVQLNFYDSSGSLLSQQSTVLAPHAQQHFNAGAVLAAGASGHVEVTPSEPNSIIGQSMFYFRYPSGSISSMYGSHLSESFGTKIFGSYNLFLGMYNWLRIVNSSASPVTGTLTLNLPNGSSHIEQLSLSARSGVDLGLHETSHFQTTSDSFGVIELESSVPFVLSAELLRIKSNEDGTSDFAMPTKVR